MSLYIVVRRNNVVIFVLVAYHSGGLQGEYVWFLLHQLTSSLGNQLDTGAIKNVRLLGGWRETEREREGRGVEREVKGVHLQLMV